MLQEERYKELSAYLPGLQPDMPAQYQKLAEIFQHQVFELCQWKTVENEKRETVEEARKEIAGETENDYYIPYMMNDALECYLILKNCHMTGEYIPPDENEGREDLGEDFENHTTGELIQEENRQGLIVRQGQQNTFTLWFSELQEEMNCYQYHRIGHFWVSGQEQWRRLVYMVGTIYDKYLYMVPSMGAWSETVCNAQEQELLKLMEFPPFRRWSPIGTSLESAYPSTLEGILCMKQFAKEAGDSTYEKWLSFYEKQFRSREKASQPSRFFRNMVIHLLKRGLTQALLSPKREALYERIHQKINEASQLYQERHYPALLEQEIQQKRENVHKALIKEGFQGNYPCYKKENQQIYAVEEHPFTILEAETFKFRIHLMVSQTGKNGESMQSGFFRGRGNKGYIIKEYTPELPLFSIHTP